MSGKSATVLHEGELAGPRIDTSSAGYSWSWYKLDWLNLPVFLFALILPLYQRASSSQSYPSDRSSSTRPTCLCCGAIGDDSPLDPPSWTSSDLDIAQAILAGRVTDRQGKPIAGALLTIERQLYWGSAYDLRRYIRDRDLSPHVKSDKDGFYRFTSLDGYKASRPFVVIASAENFATNYEENAAISEDLAHCHIFRNVVLEPVVNVKVTVKSEDGSPAKDASVGAVCDYFTAAGIHRADYADFSKTDQRGIATLSLPARRSPWTLCGQLGKSSMGQSLVTISSNTATPTVEIVLSQSVAYDGTATCVDGGFARGWALQFHPLGGNGSWLQGFPDKRGAFQISDGVPGKYATYVQRGDSFQRIGTITLQPEGDTVKLHVPGPSPGNWTDCRMKVKLKAGSVIHPPIKVTARSLFAYGGRFTIERPDQTYDKDFVLDLGKLPESTYKFILHFGDEFQDVVLDNVTVPGPVPEIEAVALSSSEVNSPAESLQVVDGTSGTEITHFLCRVFDPAGYFPNWIQCDASSTRVKLLKVTHDVDIEVSAPGYACGWVHGYKLGGSAENGVLTTRLTPGGSVEATVVDESSLPLPDATIFARSHECNYPGDPAGIAESEKPVAITDSKGHFKIEHLSAGPDVLKLFHRSKSLGLERAVVITEGENADVGILKLDRNKGPMDDLLISHD